MLHDRASDISHTCRPGSFGRQGLGQGAFADAPRFEYLLPGDARRHAKLTWYWGAVIRACIQLGCLVQVVGGDARSAVRAVAVWEPPLQVRHSILTLVRSGLMAAPLRLGLSAYRRRRAMGRLLAELDPPRPCWYLDTIGVEPSEQRTGLGTALLGTMLQRIDLVSAVVIELHMP